MSTAKFCIRHKVSTLLAVIMIVIFGAVFTHAAANVSAAGYGGADGRGGVLL